MTALQTQKGPARVPALPGQSKHSPRGNEMNEATNNTAAADAPDWTDEEAAKLREAASVEWSQWERTDNPAAWKPPTNKEWADAVNPHLFMVRIAFGSMFQTREETMAALRSLEEEDLFESTVDGIAYAIEFFRPILETLQAAEARFIVAGATLSLQRLEGAP